MSLSHPSFTLYVILRLINLRNIRYSASKTSHGKIATFPSLFVSSLPDYADGTDTIQVLDVVDDSKNQGFLPPTRSRSVTLYYGNDGTKQDHTALPNNSGTCLTKSCRCSPLAQNTIYFPVRSIMCLSYISSNPSSVHFTCLYSIIVSQ